MISMEGFRADMTRDVQMAFLVQRVGPYHHARLRALAAGADYRFVVVEYRLNEAVYVWDGVSDDGAYERMQTKTADQLIAALNQLCPKVIVCVGYSDREIHCAMAWALRRRVRMVTCSDSTHRDERRIWVKEAGKRCLVAAFDAALVAGYRAHEYLAHLGVASTRRFQPWDVVDNQYFDTHAGLARIDPPALRLSNALPQAYFLCVARFVPKKNLERLIAAYARYVSQAMENSWALVLAGSGPLERTLRAEVATAGLASRVKFSGNVGYADLPTYYALAEALIMPSVSDQWGLVVNEAMAAGLPVLVSSRCGCAPDLVREGENGFTFDPENVEQIAKSMSQLHRLDAEQRRAMGQCSREIIADYSPEAFARGLDAAITQAFEEKPRRRGMFTQLAVRSLAARQP